MQNLSQTLITPPKIEMEELRDYEMANALITFNENKVE